MDALSDALRAVKLGGAVYLTAEFSAPWCVEGRVDAVLFAAYLPTYKRLVAYHLVVEGSLHAQIAADDSSAIEVFAGEILVVPQGETHRLGSDRGLRPTSFAQVAADEVDTIPGEVMNLTYGGGGARTRIVCGFLACDDVLSNPLIASLPHIFKVDVRKGWSKSCAGTSIPCPMQKGTGSLDCAIASSAGPCSFYPRIQHARGRSMNLRAK
jgi:hypothetical protein